MLIYKEEVKTLIIIIFLIFSIQKTIAQVSFLPYQLLPNETWPETVCIGDMNHDGLNDIVLGAGVNFGPDDDDKLYVFLQNTQGCYDTAILYSYLALQDGVSSLDVGDLNNDQKQDVVFAFNDSIGIFFQNASGSLDQPVCYYSGISPSGIITGDLNHDGLTDIAVSNWNDDHLRIFYQSATGFNTHDYPKQQSGNPDLVIGDINHDGLNDLVTIDADLFGGVHVYTQNASGLLNPDIIYHPTSPGGDYISLDGVALGDLNNDGQNDLIVTNYHNVPLSSIFIYFQDTSTGLLINPPVEIHVHDLPQAVKIADLNCDGKNEIIVFHHGAALTCLQQNDSGNFSLQQYIYTTGSGWFINPMGTRIGDVNNDGILDVVIADMENGAVILLNNTGPVGFVVYDTLTSIDTVSTITITESYFFVNTSIDTLSNYEVTRIDSFLVTNTYRSDSIRFDSLFMRK
ncbi:MAG: VCBS repeat-containing protein [Bacteroidetes bacterium]|nr:VCBS repeat-containing protein [Bacteroidota bacterium]